MRSTWFTLYSTMPLLTPMTYGITNGEVHALIPCLSECTAHNWALATAVLPALPSQASTHQPTMICEGATR
jgi:hypothetical protein